METKSIQSWGPRSISFWLSMLIAVGIIFIGIRFILSPFIAGDGYGITLNNDHTIGYAYAKGIRDIFSGMVLLIFLIRRNAGITAILFSTAIIIPVTDFFIVLHENGTSDITHLMIHGGTAVYMLIVSFLLFRIKK